VFYVSGRRAADTDKILLRIEFLSHKNNVLRYTYVPNIITLINCDCVLLKNILASCSWLVFGY